MTLTSREAMRALVDGHAVRLCSGAVVYLDDDGHTVYTTEDETVVRRDIAINLDKSQGIVDTRFTMSLAGALRAMADGQSVQSEHGDIYSLDTAQTTLMRWDDVISDWAPVPEFPAHEGWRVFE